MNRLNRWLSLGLVIILGFLLGISGFSVWDKSPAAADRVAWSAQTQWIAPQAPTYRFYARRSFFLNDVPEAAWLRLSADNDFILYVNGRAIARDRNILYHSLGLGSRFSEDFQRANDSVAYRSRGYDWIQLANAKDWKLTTYVDLTRHLQAGRNTIAIEVQKSRQNPRVVVEGAVYPLSTSPAIDLATGTTPWLVSNLNEAHNGLLWFDRDFPDESWSSARTIGSVREGTYNRLSPRLFDRFLEGNWITGIESSQGEVWLRSDWQIPQHQFSRAFIRFAGDGKYALLINGLLVNRYEADRNNDLHMYEVTNFLHPGNNTLAVHLTRPIHQLGAAAPFNPLGFFLDGWAETKSHAVIAPIATNNTWKTLEQPVSGWYKGEGEGQAARVLGSPDVQKLERTFEGDAYLLNYPDYLWHFWLWQLAGVGCAVVSAWSLGRFWLDDRHSWWNSLGAGAELLLPGTLFLIGIGLLKHRYAEAERGLLFFQQQSDSLILLGFLVVVLLTLLWSWRERKLACLGLWLPMGLTAFVSLSLVGSVGVSPASMCLILFGFGAIALFILLPSRTRHDFIHRLATAYQAYSPIWNQWLILGAIVAIGFIVRTYNLGFVDLDADENTSLDATRGILRTGAPQATSGIWYTRSPAYHYMLALWLRLFGDSVVNARFLSVLWGTATLVLVFILTRKITGKAWLALIVTAILAFDPSQVYFSRFIRFYQVVQCLSILSFWLFLKGFVERSGRAYQYGFFIALTLTILNQEVTVTLLPCFFVGFIFFYRPFRWADDWQIVVSSIVSMGIIAYDLVFFSIRCLTPWVALSDSTDAYLKVHFFSISGLANNFFVGPSRMHIIYSFFFFLGWIYFLKRRDGKTLFLFNSVSINLILLTILIYQIATRYTYQIYPIFILLAVYSAACIAESLASKFEVFTRNSLPTRGIAIASIVLLLILNVEPNRVLASYQDALTRRNNEAFAYISSHRQPGDVVISTSPAAASTGLGGLDYFIPGNIRFDVFYWNNGRVIDRWGGGKLISNLDQMSHVLENSKRVWLHVDNHTEGRFEPVFRDYIETLGQPIMETFGARVRLWKPEDGVFPHVPYQGGDLGAY
ncbi:glycosyltransferase family 39 protein [Scytonema millei]|uniref:Glycosyl transferase n=1 Tax=Scytonema millei VB511283 TaxID=1245923 RepID=A0A9X5I1R6_9CYAN|nr:glycosyltransferase family 39 protein [Scytonema millei]NHC33433.1 glycosyl transferase [Scytonema millei VB511283]